MHQFIVYMWLQHGKLSDCFIYLLPNVKLNDLSLGVGAEAAPSPDSRGLFVMSASLIHQSVTKLNLQQSDQTHLKSETRAVASFTEEE